MLKLRYLLPLVIVGCTSTQVVKISDNLYSVSEKSQPTLAAAEHIPDPAIDDINSTAADYCKQNNQKVKVISFDRPMDPAIRQGLFTMKFSCVLAD